MSDEKKAELLRNKYAEIQAEIDQSKKIQQLIIQKTRALRDEIDRQRASATQIRQEAEAGVEAMILGTKQV